MEKLQPKSNATLAEGLVVAKALLRAADRLGLTARVMGAVLGLSEPSVSRLKKGEFNLERGTKSFELAVLFIRLYRSLDAIVGGDEKIARAWLRNDNTALGGKPIEKIQTIPGLVDAIAYLDARRAIV
ncbi:MbcA/ParS/Xre antitoxin family protein [Chelativorans sp. J32]|uniref:MbcA/ParS/Xre antitoxin family protein n=1 Tax=Chelativorans sp. J32 TaxID=935840 RepID=UPI000485184C|nr:MbcA/ParS/Xre antitoxin family protein [Chelativorans sp. J32]